MKKLILSIYALLFFFVLNGQIQNRFKPEIELPTAKIFDNFNSDGVNNGPNSDATFTINQQYKITSIQTYHWNNAQGSSPGAISLRSNSGVIYGPWTAVGSVGTGVSNVFWTVSPHVTIPAGTYTVIVSNNATWSHNSKSQNKGFVKVFRRL